MGKSCYSTMPHFYCKWWIYWEYCYLDFRLSGPSSGDSKFISFLIKMLQRAFFLFFSNSVVFIYIHSFNEYTIYMYANICFMYIYIILKVNLKRYKFLQTDICFTHRNLKDFLFWTIQKLLEYLFEVFTQES